MIGSVSQFEEPWPSEETRLVADAIRAAIAAPRPQDDAGADRGDPRAARWPAASGGQAGGAESALAAAGRRWALAHQSASLMRTRLEALEASLDIGPEADRAAYHRAWRVVTDAATWTSLDLLEEAAMLDPLTRVGNRRSLDKMLRVWLRWRDRSVNPRDDPTRVARGVNARVLLCQMEGEVLGPVSVRAHRS